jgi:NAD+ synthase
MSTQDTLIVDFVQDNAHVGNITGNLSQVLGHLENSQADLVVFPECFLTGYPLQDMVLRPGFLAEVDNALDQLAHHIRAQGGPAVLIGAPLPGSDLPFNAAVLIRQDGTRQVAVKTELPNNDVFDERRIFARGSNPAPLTLGSWRLGVMICEDMWHGRVARTLGDEGADMLLVLNGSPMEMDKQPVRLRHATRRVQSTGLPLVYLNLVGGQDELVFDGASFVLDGDNHLISQHPFTQTTFRVVFARDAQGRTIIDSSSPLNPYPDRQEAIYRTLVLGMRDYVVKNGFSDVLLGLSGGLDSAIVAAIAADAISPQRVITLMLPAQWTGQESVGLADEMARVLGCQYATVPVSPITQALEAALAACPIGGQTEGGIRIANENIQARARGNLLMALSNARPGTLVLSTGNKSEMSVGYATLYGDMCGGFNPIKDLYKTQVQALTAWRNTLTQADLENMGLLGPVAPVPTGILTRPPTAELAPDQTDENALGAYPMLDAVLSGLIEAMLDPVAAARVASDKLGYSVEEAYARKIAGLVRRAEYKRRQAPPGIKVSGRSFGFGWRYPITNAGSL